MDETGRCWRWKSFGRERIGTRVETVGDTGVGGRLASFSRYFGFANLLAVLDVLWLEQDAVRVRWRSVFGREVRKQGGGGDACEAWRE